MFLIPIASIAETDAIFETTSKIVKCGQVTHYSDSTQLECAIPGVHILVPQLPGQGEKDYYHSNFRSCPFPLEFSRNGVLVYTDSPIVASSVGSSSPGTHQGGSKIASIHMCGTR